MVILEYTPENIKKAARVLKRGGVIAHPADTCYGFAADFKNKKALKKVIKIKNRDTANPMSIMLPVIAKDDIVKYAVLSDFARMVTDRLLPGPVTILLPKGPAIPKDYYPDTPYIGIRIPYDSLTQDLLTAFMGPLITTSANISEEGSAATGQEVIKLFKNRPHRPDIVFQGKINSDCLPSTVILVKDHDIQITRPGPMTESRIRRILGI
jgi:L-threonylcarbamoyladenylate synthase